MKLGPIEHLFYKPGAQMGLHESRALKRNVKMVLLLVGLAAILLDLRASTVAASIVTVGNAKENGTDGITDTSPHEYDDPSNEHATGGHETKGEEEGIRAASWLFDEFYIHITIMVFLLIVIILKMVYHRLEWLSAYVPESLILICLGVIFGTLIRFAHVDSNIETWKLTPKLFFEFLLPPIVLESAYSLYNRTFGEFLGIILIYAVLGTIMNFLIIGPVMYGLDLVGAMGWPTLHLDIKGYLLFSSLIVAVDPVAVLAIFQDIGVDLGLYYMVFGESLLNDAVTVVLYQIMQAFAGKEEISGEEIGVGFASFFTVSLGGLLVGVVVGIATCFITQFSSSMEVIIVLMLGYFAYIMGDVVGWSGIISMIGCGLVQASYAFHNLRPSNVMIVKKVSKMAAELSEAVIFLFIGIELFRDNMIWHTGFHFWSLTMCLISRLIVVLVLTAIINWVRVDGFKISITEQFIVIYGGLRGAVAFSLSVLIREESLGQGLLGIRLKGIFITSTLFIILFTVGFMGMTMKPLVRLLKIKMQANFELSLFNKLNEHILDQALAAIETISGEKGRNVVREFCIRIDDRYVRRVLQRDPETHDQKIVKVYEKMALKLHYATIGANQAELHLDELPETIKSKLLNKTLSTANFFVSPSEVNLDGVQLQPETHFPEPRDHFGLPSKDGINGKSSIRQHAYPSRQNHELMVTRRRSSSIFSQREPFDDPMQMMAALRCSRRPSLMDGGKHQEEFQQTFLEMIRSKGLALKRHPLSSKLSNMPETALEETRPSSVMAPASLGLATIEERVTSGRRLNPLLPVPEDAYCPSLLSQPKLFSLEELPQSFSAADTDAEMQQQHADAKQPHGAEVAKAVQASKQPKVSRSTHSESTESDVEND
ncbi:unnamed protein product [Protopolystoma xenopodis]|uniref:Sodium/hydrogen exchanger n=1 Tax=Protopolystoma xenopodis TaxID=117903 RepID=A0A448XMC2_9PLAT|nr:unnamed protein product [Protopolystoma xenopodis]